MAARFFVDENDLALGKALAGRRVDVVFPGHPGLPELPRETLDDDWLAVIGEKGLVVITRDKRIRYRPVEKRRWLEQAVRGFVLTGTTSQSTADSIRVLDAHWVAIEEVLVPRPAGPWMFAVTARGLREIQLGGTPS